MQVVPCMPQHGSVHQICSVLTVCNMLVGDQLALSATICTIHARCHTRLLQVVVAGALDVTHGYGLLSTIWPPIC